MTAEELSKLVGENIKKYRKSNGWTLIELKKKSGIDVNTISAVENGYRIPSGRVLVQLADVFDVEPWQFYATEEDICAFEKALEILNTLMRKRD